ncbi:hypothetical protein ACFE04_008059 [Oxalis oulophora]
MLARLPIIGSVSRSKDSAFFGFRCQNGILTYTLLITEEKDTAEGYQRRVAGRKKGIWSVIVAMNWKRDPAGGMEEKPTRGLEIQLLRKTLHLSVKMSLKFKNSTKGCNKAKM